MKGLHITYDLHRADPVRLAYFVKAWGFEIAHPKGRYFNNLIVTNATHPVDDAVELLHNSGCRNILIYTKNYAHFIELTDNVKLRELGVEMKYNKQLKGQQP